jgi:hypothetical protein
MSTTVNSTTSTDTTRPSGGNSPSFAEALGGAIGRVLAEEASRMEAEKKEKTEAQPSPTLPASPSPQPDRTNPNI